MTKTLVIVTLSALTLLACESKSTKPEACGKPSEWRDNNGFDSCSFYPENKTCDKILGKLEIRSRLHKSTLTKGVFEGGVSSRWLEIGKDSITYFEPSGEIADKGSCTCSKGTLKMDWEKGDNLPEEAEIYFKTADFVELRYYDYPFSFNTFQYDTLKEKTNPTKIVGAMK